MADERRGPKQASGNAGSTHPYRGCRNSYSSTSFSIKYRSSINLDEANGQIHKNYNGWIQNLQKGINTQLSMS